MHSAVIVCCIESGALEAQVVRLAESLRQNGGSFSAAPIVAVRPRCGPALARSTRQALGKMDVQLIEQRTNRKFAWQHYTNKVLALLAAEEAIQAEQYIWLDSDVMVLAEPRALWLEAEEDFTACAPDKGVLGSVGPEDSQDAAWHRACGALEIAIDSLPWVITCVEKAKIRFYLNSGVFAYRSGKRFAQEYEADCFRYLRAKASKTHSEVHF